MAATTGLGQKNTALKDRFNAGRNLRTYFGPTELKRIRSTPAENIPPWPVITTARAADSEICSKHFASWSLSSMSSALALPWVMVTVAMPLSFFRSIMSVSFLVRRRYCPVPSTIPRLRQAVRAGRTRLGMVKVGRFWSALCAKKSAIGSRSGHADLFLHAADASATEKAMLSLRGVTAGAIVLFMSSAAIEGAVAQTATTDAPGKPLQLLRIIEAPARPKAVAHNRIHAALHRVAAVRSVKRHTVVAEAKTEQSTPTAQDTTPTVSADDADTPAPASFAAAEPAAQAAPSPGAPVMGPLVVGNQAVEVASQTDVNALDLAADKTADAPANAAPVNTASDDAAPSAKMAAMSGPAATVVSDTASKSDSIKADFAAPAPEAAKIEATKAAVGSPGWIAQVMAALAGAVAAGSIAWFLIGAAPRRAYG
jgi:hypothetical protein